MCAPLLSQGQVIGALYVGNDKIKHLFERTQLELLSIFASQASLLLQHALLFDALAPKPYLELPPPWLVAHRGGSRIAPENASLLHQLLDPDCLPAYVSRSGSGGGTPESWRGLMILGALASPFIFWLVSRRMQPDSKGQK